MFARLNQVARQLSRSYPAYTRTSAAGIRPGIANQPRIMAAQNNARMIHTAGCLIIGDEVLGGKTRDTNSNFFAKYCFDLGIQLKRIEVIADDEEEIIEATRRMSDKYDFVVTSGGIGPTHDDITYQSIAKAFSLPLVEHQVAFERMKRLSKPHKLQKDFSWDVPSPALEAKKRMIILPNHPSIPDEQQVLFVVDDLWVPIAVVNGNIHILPGVPSLFEKLLTGLKPFIASRLENPEGKGVYRVLFSTPLPESEVAPYLTELASKVEAQGIKVGSYPRWGKSRNTVTLVGKDLELMESLIPEVEKAVKGRRIQIEGEDDDQHSDPDA